MYVTMYIRTWLNIKACMLLYSTILILFMFYMCKSMPLIKIGGTYTKPLLLPPEVAIGGFGKIQVCTWIICDHAIL